MQKNSKSVRSLLSTGTISRKMAQKKLKNPLLKLAVSKKLALDCVADPKNWGLR